MYLIVLEKRGYEVDTAEDGEVALQKLQSTSLYDLVLLDIMLPKVDGISVLRKIKDPSSTRKTTPVFLLTNLGFDNIIKEAMSLGAEKYFVKANFLPKDIVHEVDSFLQPTT
jgi:CheY-like chemotaxis protein